MGTKREWYGEWFDSKYYHILYKNRDFEEAGKFIDNLTRFLNINRHDQILDLACGRGRFSIYLNRKGYKVTGIDLSSENIAEAKKSENENLKFSIHDMREVYCHECFDYIINMFTSFGYFDTREENEQVIVSAVEALKAGGKLILDFLNPYVVVHNLIPEEEKQIESINFHIKRCLSDDGFILKDIEINDHGNKHHFQEKVKAIRRTEFMEYFDKAGLNLVEIFGDYNLNSYVPETSERMIFILNK